MYYLRSPLLKSEVVTGQLVCWKAYESGFHIIAWHFLNVMARRRVPPLDIIYLFSSPTSYPWALLSHWARDTGPPPRRVAVNFSASHLQVTARFYDRQQRYCLLLFYLLLLGGVSFLSVSFSNLVLTGVCSISSTTGHGYRRRIVRVNISLWIATHIFYKCCSELLLFLEIIKLSRRKWEKEKKWR